MILDWLLSLSRSNKRFVAALHDTACVIGAYVFATWLRLGGVGGPIGYLETTTIAITCIVTIAFFAAIGVYRTILRYLTLHFLVMLVIGAAFSALTVIMTSLFLDVLLPRTVPLIYFVILLMLCCGSRLFIRYIVLNGDLKVKKPVLIYGAGAAGRQLGLALKNSESYRVLGFIDSDPNILNTIVMGLNVYNVNTSKKIVDKYCVQQVLLAVPNATRQQRKSILDSLVSLPAEVLTIPDMQDIVEGRAKIDQLIDVPIEDLLGREPVVPLQFYMESDIKDKVVMVTGAGGSIGSELCRQILHQAPKVLVLFEVSEFGLYQIDRELNLLKEKIGHDVKVVPLLGSVQRPHRLLTAMTSFGVQTVYHAAAYKHVPLVEYNVVEGVRNNIYGTYRAAKAAIDAGVESFVLISTDKAVRPTNVMGATKRIAELGLQALAQQQNQQGSGTRFCMVRFGNVLGSSGSVIPLFKRQIKAGGPLTVTHPDITRFFMTIPEAAQLVIQAGAMGKGGDVFVLDMGESVKIADLAENLVRLSGLSVKSDLNPDGDIRIEFSGLRPGEKLYEELLIGDNVERTAHERIMTAQEMFLPLKEYEELLNSLDLACHSMNHEKVRELLLSAPADFNPTNGIEDLVWNTGKLS